MSKDVPRKDVHALDRAVERRLKGGRAVGPEAEPGMEGSLLDLFVSGGPALPAAARVESLKSGYMARGTALGQQEGVGHAASRPAIKARVRAHPVFSGVAAIAAAVMVLLVGLGFGSAYAMPGNPLYPVKRMAESAYLSVVPGDQGKADAYAAWTNRRLNDLEYVEERGMGEWYYGLVEDARGGIEDTCERGKRLRAGASEKVNDRARALTLRLEALLGKAQGRMTPSEKAKTESGMERLRLRLRMGQGAPSGPSQQNGQPGNQDDRQQNGQQNGAPSEPGTQQQQNQNQQQQQEQQQQEQQQQEQEQPQQPQQPQQQQNQQQVPRTHSIVVEGDNITREREADTGKSGFPKSP